MFEPAASMTMHTEMAYAIKQLLEAALDPQIATVPGPSRLRELTYEALRGSHGHALRALAADHGHYARIARSLQSISANLDGEFQVWALAKQAGISVSGFHAGFKQVTQTSPIQYLKRCRLLRAQALISRKLASIATIASQVG